MKRADLEKFIEDNFLLENVQEAPGIYAITVDGFIAYIGQSRNMYERCSQHIYNTENATFINEKKYLLLLSAKLGGHRIDCISLQQTDISSLLDLEAAYIDKYDPCLNINKPKGRNDINNMKIEDLLMSLEWEAINETYNDNKQA